MLGGADRVVASGGGHRRFFIIYRFVEDYLPVPTIIGAVVKVSPWPPYVSGSGEASGSEQIRRLM